MRRADCPGDRLPRRACGVELCSGCKLHARRLDRLDSRVEHDLHAPVSELVQRVFANVRLEHRKELWACLDEEQPRVFGRHTAVVLREIAPIQLAQGADALDACRAAADDDHVERSVLDERRVTVGRLPSLDEVRAEAERIFNRVQRKGVLRSTVAAEELDRSHRARERDSRTEAAACSRTAPRVSRGRLLRPSPDGPSSSSGSGRDRGVNAQPTSCRADPSQADTASAETCGSRSRRPKRRRRPRPQAPARRPDQQNRHRERRPGAGRDRTPMALLQPSPKTCMRPGAGASPGEDDPRIPVKVQVCVADGRVCATAHSAAPVFSHVP